MASVVWDYVLNKLRCRDNGGGGSQYVLPPATPTTLGGVKVGEGLSVTPDGTLSLATPLAPVVVSDDPPALADGETADWFDPATGVMQRLAAFGGVAYAVELTATDAVVPALPDLGATDWRDPATGRVWHLARAGGRTYAVEMTRLT